MHLQKLANINLAKNVPTNLMRNVLGFLQPLKRKYWKAFKQICKPLKIKKEDVPHSQTRKRESKKEIESHKKSA